ncbi:ABC transporter substrate-binding protein [Flavitalea sp. BT771]|uniref:ABC transporter substrate-binding protein n=1 Tax=Flavitalea sp. BT771 TaxID=3063329 RepID=UPI0026E419C2|nr:ABC transporter substrate-binding protein [Flavitalea sp. BT771]MDO6434094.1 ABC transporter substrate-binding protein [Flavitalea sp. BT771]MDV6222994.1 ABC transporter substrate-binding protein [Flavitalea sp. BT771]
MINIRLFYCALLLTIFSCKERTAQNTPPPAVDNSDSPGVSTTIRYAHGFTIDYHDHYKLVHVLDRKGEVTDTLEYLLVQKGHPAPAGHPKAQVIPIPVSSFIAMSSMHVGMADFLGIADRITGLGSLQYINSPVVRANIKAGKTIQVGLDGNLNNELLISLHPGLIIAMSNPEATTAKYKTLMDAGIPVILNAEWLESTPLGRAEWVKLMAALVNKEDLVNKKFDSVARSYDSLVRLASQVKEHPRVIIGMPYKGSWFVPAGDSYMAHFIRDAGGGYKWADTKGVGSLALNFEAVAPEALKADFWLNIGYLDRKQDITAKDTRFASFRSFSTGQLFNNNKRTNDIGSNDYWESGAVNPQVLLADMISILHPELLPGHTLVYYKQLP